MSTALQLAKKKARRALELAGIDYKRRNRYGVLFGDAYESQTRLLKHNGITPKQIVDIGAYDGDTAIKYLDLFPGATVHAFEPFPETYAKLEAVAREDARILPVKTALADSKGDRTLYAMSGVQTNSLLPSVETASHHVNKTLEMTGEVTVEVDTLDAYWGDRAEQIDILKMDIQGGELDALRGASSLLENQRIELIYTEVELQQIYKDQPLFPELFLFLREYGYKFYSLYDTGVNELGEMHSADAIFYSPKLRID